VDYLISLTNSLIVRVPAGNRKYHSWDLEDDLMKGLFAEMCRVEGTNKAA
jgi:hypothetical protein